MDCLQRYTSDLLGLSPRCSKLIGLFTLIGYVLVSSPARAGQPNLSLNPTGITQLEGTWFYTDKENFHFDKARSLESQFDTRVAVPHLAEGDTLSDHFYARVISFDGWDQAKALI